jgi:hypothetical protein
MIFVWRREWDLNPHAAKRRRVSCSEIALYLSSCGEREGISSAVSDQIAQPRLNSDQVKYEIKNNAYLTNARIARLQKFSYLI